MIFLVKFLSLVYKLWRYVFESVVMSIKFINAHIGKLCYFLIRIVEVRRCIMDKILILYNNAEENTLEYIEKISFILERCKYISVKDFNESYEDYNVMLVYLDMSYEQKELEFLNLLSNYKDIFKKKKLFFFTFDKNLKDYEWIKSTIEKVTNSDLVDYRYINKKIGEVYKYGLEVKTIVEKYDSQLDEQSLKSFIEDFISKRSVASIYTLSKDNSTSTPTEYIYKDEYIYIYSEEGIKFFNSLQSNKISLSIYDNYTDFHTLRGMQISGVAYIISPKSEIYNEVLKLKNINKWTMSNLLSVIKIKIKKVEFLNSEFKKLGYDIKQVYHF